MGSQIRSCTLWNNKAITEDKCVVYSFYAEGNVFFFLFFFIESSFHFFRK